MIAQEPRPNRTRASADPAEAFHPVAVDGPLVIVGRPRSGSRVLARAFVESGVFVGSDLTADALDSAVWANRFVVPLVASRFFPDWDLDAPAPELAAFCDERRADATRRFAVPRGAPAWGWKFCETLFVMPIVKRLWPDARFLHVIRDGRDVCLSNRGFFQVTGAHADPPGWSPAPLPPAVARDRRAERPVFADFCRSVTFDDPSIRSWHGVDLTDRRQLVERRFLIQMQSWVNCVTRARRFGGALGDAYVEVRYEDLCARPVDVARTVFRRLGARLGTAAEAYLSRTVVRDRVQRWRAARLTPRETRDFADACDLGAALLEELGYAR